MGLSSRTLSEQDWRHEFIMPSGMSTWQLNGELQSYFCD